MMRNNVLHKRFNLDILQSFTTCAVNRDVGNCRCKGDKRPPPPFQQKNNNPVPLNELRLQVPPDIQIFRPSYGPGKVKHRDFSVQRKSFCQFSSQASFYVCHSTMQVRDRRYSVYILIGKPENNRL